MIIPKKNYEVWLSMAGTVSHEKILQCFESTLTNYRPVFIKLKPFSSLHSTQNTEQRVTFFLKFGLNTKG